MRGGRCVPRSVHPRSMHPDTDSAVLPRACADVQMFWHPQGAFLAVQVGWEARHLHLVTAASR